MSQIAIQPLLDEILPSVQVGRHFEPIDPQKEYAALQREIGWARDPKTRDRYFDYPAFNTHVARYLKTAEGQTKRDDILVILAEGMLIRSCFDGLRAPGYYMDDYDYMYEQGIHMEESAKRLQAQALGLLTALAPEGKSLSEFVGSAFGGPEAYGSGLTHTESQDQHYLKIHLQGVLNQPSQLEGAHVGSRER